MTIYGTYTESGSIVRASDNACIPADPANRDYREAMDALEAGYTISAYEAPTQEAVRALLPSITARQLRLALVRSGTPLSAVEAALAMLPAGTTRDEALIEWEAATQFRRTDPLLVQIGAALGYTPEEIDALWLYAAGL